MIRQLSVSWSTRTGKSKGMPHPEPARPLHATMLEMLREARRRGMAHSACSLEVCASRMAAHAPTGEQVGSPCGGCLERWPCGTVLAIIGGVERAA